jgi:formyl-CoA transferase
MEHSASARAVGGALAGLTTAEARQRLEAAGVPCAEPRRYWAEDATADPLLRRHGVVLAEYQPEAGDIYEVAHTVRFGTATRQHNRPAPALGQHTAQVLHELGRSDAEIEALAAQGVILTGEVPAGVR